MSGNVVRTKMADAFIGALALAVHEGKNPGRIGKRILTNKAKGVGVLHNSKRSKAVSAEERKVA